MGIIFSCDFYSSFGVRGKNGKEIVNQEGKEWNKMEMNEFNFIIVWIVKDGKE